MGVRLYECSETDDNDMCVSDQYLQASLCACVLLPCYPVGSVKWDSIMTAFYSLAHFIQTA